MCTLRNRTKIRLLWAVCLLWLPGPAASVPAAETSAASREGAIAVVQPLAAQAGQHAYRAGGNAVDAAVAAARRYRPGFYPGRLTIVLPSAADQSSPDRFLDWHRFAAGSDVEIGPDGCDGSVMLQAPHVSRIAELLNAAIARADDQHEGAAPRAASRPAG